MTSEDVMSINDIKHDALEAAVGHDGSINALEREYWKQVASGGTPSGGGARTGGVTSVNGKTGRVALAAQDVGAYSTSDIDGKLQPLSDATSTLTADVVSVKNKTSAVEGRVGSLENSQQAIGADIRQLQSTQLAGVTVADKEGNSFADITGITFEGATVEDPTGQQTVEVSVKPKITVADGQSPDSTAVTGNAIIVQGAKVSSDPRDSNIVRVDIPAHTGTVNVQPLDAEVDGQTYTGFDVIEFDDFTASQTGKKLTVTAPPSTGGTSGIELDNKTSNIAGVKKLNFPTSQFLARSSTEVDITPYMNIGGVLAENIKMEAPIKVVSDPDNQYSAKMYIAHDAYEPMHKPSFLAYLKEDEEVVGKTQNDNSHHNGAIWFDDVVKGAGVYLIAEKATKSYGIQEADQLDPNVSGGTDYLISFRVALKGKAPDDGFVRAYLFDRVFNDFSERGILKDKSGNLMAVERHYKAGETLGVLEVTGVVNAKSIQEFTCHVVDNFADDTLVLEDRTEGATGLMIQAITSEEKTGEGLVQYELDTGSVITFSSHYLGADRATIGWITQRPQAVVELEAWQGDTMTDGLHLANRSPMRFGVEENNLIFSDNGSDVCDFNFGKIFSAEETQLLRGKDIDVTVELVDKNSAWNISLMKWTGTPDEYTDKIYTGRNNESIVLEKGWEEASKAFISEDVVTGMHKFQHSFTVPTDANNYAIIIYPVTAQQPLALTLHSFTVDVSEPFVGYAIKEPKLVSEQHLAYSDKYKEFTQNTQGFVSLRYTINDSELPMPCGIPSKGLADVDLDSSVNKIAGSGAKGGEGAIRFNTDGVATVSTQLNVWNEQNTPTDFKFWWASVASNGVMTKIDDSELSATIPANTKGATFMMPTFKLDVEGGDRIALRASASKADGAFIECVSDRNPAVQTTIQFKELATVP